MESSIEGRLADLAAQRAADKIHAALDLAREFLDMELGYFTQFTHDEQTYRGVSGEGESFDVVEDAGYPLEGTYCQRMVLGQLPNVVPDTSENEQVAHLALTELGQIGSYVGVPVEFSDGRLYGTLCTISHDPRPDLGERHVALMRILASFVAAELERQFLLEEVRGLKGRIAELEAGEAEEDVRQRLEELLPSDEFGQSR